MGQNREDSEEFGFRAVPPGEKKKLVRGVFSSVAGRYDLMNDLMSGGVHRLWKAALLDRLAPQPGQRLVDVAGGTGDIALGFLKCADAQRGAGEAEAVICDINADMLLAGAGRPEAAAYQDRLRRVCGDAERLPVPDRAFDAYTIGFGIRNVSDMRAALSEAYRVLRPGGRFVCLEFSHPTTEGLQRLYDLYSFNVIPRLGEAVTGDRESYQYLVESIRRFPAQETFAEMIAQAGFSRVRYENLTFGVAALHTAWRL